MKRRLRPEIKKRLGRLPLLVLGMLSLFAGIWGGLLRLPLNVPLLVDHANWISYHGPLMVCGFLGTLIGLERAVGLRSGWAYLAPLLTGAGAMALIAGMLGRPPVILIVSGSTIFALVTVRVVRLQPAAFTVIMSMGAWAWVVGNVLWYFEWPFHRVVPWWMAFLALTILGERLDLGRFRKPSRWAPRLLWMALGLFLAGIVLSVWAQAAGERAAGAGMLFLALWLGRFDIARHTVKQTGLTRFMAVCLLVGYGWLATAGVLLLTFSPLESGMAYDAVLHSFFLGFIFAMIFGHAPVIFPAILQAPISFRRSFYLHVLVLQFALLLRVGADLADWVQGRQWGSIFNGIAIVLFLANTIRSLAFPGQPDSSKTAGP